MKSASVRWLGPSAARGRLFFPFFRALLAPEKGRVDCTSGSASPLVDSPELDESSGLSTYLIEVADVVVALFVLRVLLVE
jgi:hypothetical protein